MGDEQREREGAYQSRYYREVTVPTDAVLKEKAKNDAKE